MKKAYFDECHHIANVLEKDNHTAQRYVEGSFENQRFQLV